MSKRVYYKKWDAFECEVDVDVFEVESNELI